MMSTASVHRARPLLGTVVSIRIGGMSAVRAAQAVDAGFEAIVAVHKLMSFHEPQSDVSRLNRGAANRAVAVDHRTFRVIEHAINFARESGGCFDITVASELVTRGLLPRPEAANSPDRLASWRDIELLGDERIRFHRPLWIDLGGIAKGFAVDHAFDQMPLDDISQARVNAGGDLRVRGPFDEQILLNGGRRGGMIPVLRLQEGSIASSSSNFETRAIRRTEAHIHGIHKKPIGCRRFVSVIARECLVADALTKIVLTRGRKSAAILKAHGASAYLWDRRGWLCLGGNTTT